MRYVTACFVIFTVVVWLSCGSVPAFTLKPASAVLLPGQTLQFEAIGAANPVWMVNGVRGGSAAVGTITSGGLYTAPSTPAQHVLVEVDGGVAPAPVTIFNPAQLDPGTVAATQNPLVASYTLSAPAGTSVHVQFGPDTSYRFSTSAVQAPLNGGAVTVLVAGMRANSTYHMQAVVDLVNGSQVLDTDHSFTTGSIPASRLPSIAVQQTGVGAPSSGIELLSLHPDDNGGNLLSAVATDLEGNVIWYYDLESEDWPYPIKPLPNGHMLVIASSVNGTTGFNEIREIDLAGNVINRITLEAVNLALQGVASFSAASFHHDVAILPNGHWILLANYQETVNNVAGVPPGTAVIGDALIDWDPQRGPVWTWSTFDHLDVARAPYGNVDWTHANAIVYSPDDGNIILSMRNQNWIIKIDYRDGEGDGSILWRFGDGGDFTLPGQDAPIEWNYGQHYPTVVSPNSAGVFSLMFFNNGNNRLMDSNNTVCGTAGTGACYSSVPIFQLNESTKTASVLWEDNLLPSYSDCCGDALILPNGDVEYDVAADLGTAITHHIDEVTQTQTPQLVWEMQIAGQLPYRGFRIPSLYPGQTWPASIHQSTGVQTHQRRR
ncbi:MAG TPA: aryl-sulfate sulfotransferase [Terriglobales bacterium]|nr:aryl-sulfate sulfotransferase [Terriglobales bacterium]